MPGATSLIELILKKWGDDIAGAAKELEEKVGFPESVANRIATGELPMDAESVAKRAQDQGYDLSSRWYHGTNEDFSEFDPIATHGTLLRSMSTKESPSGYRLRSTDREIEVQENYVSLDPLVTHGNGAQATTKSKKVNRIARIHDPESMKMQGARKWSVQQHYVE